MALDPKLVEILACPLCKTKVLEIGDTLLCANRECRRQYAVTDGIPVMLIDEATILDSSEYDSKVASAKA